MNFGGSNQELQLHFGTAWSEFAERVLPRESKRVETSQLYSN